MRYMIWLMAALMAGFTAPAKAALVTYTLEPTPFYSILSIPDGGLLSGSFTLDNVNGVLSNTLFTTTASSIIDPGFTFDMGEFNPGDAPIAFYNADSLDNNGNLVPGGSVILLVSISINSAGSLIGGAEQAYCTQSDQPCTMFGIAQSGIEIYQDALITMDVPEPASLAILGFGLAGLAVVRRRHG